MEVFRGQNYDKIRRNCLKSGTAWMDPKFPASQASLGLQFASGIKWLRPTELCKTPGFVTDGVSLDDVNQGRLGNCWFLAACSVLTTSKVRWSTVVPNASDQEYQVGKDHPGIFRFRFWRFGKWTEVVVDDRLPCNKDGKLLFAHSSAHCEFWIALLEKAYAKLHGTYANLEGGYIADALVDFTSGVSEVFNRDNLDALWGNPEAKLDLFKKLRCELKEHALVCCGSYPKEQRQTQGIVNGHAYSVTAVQKVRLKKIRKVGNLNKNHAFLIRLRNPWGQVEWTGRFSDKSPEWNTVATEDFKNLGLVVQNDGEFWMPFDDFLQYFDEACVCKVMNKAIGTGVKGNFAERPQFRFDIQTVNANDRKEVILQLSQRDTRSIPEEHNKQIGFMIYKVELNRKHKMHHLDQDQYLNFDKDNVVDLTRYEKRKHVFLKTLLTSGRYVLVPGTMPQGETRDFLLRMYTENNPNLTILKPDMSRRSTIFTRPPNTMSRVTIQTANGLNKNQDFYCKVKSDVKAIRGHLAPGSGPQQLSMMFYRRQNKAESPLKLTIWKKNMFMANQFMGQAVIKTNDNGNQTLELQDKLGRPVSAQVKVKIETTQNFKAI